MKKISTAVQSLIASGLGLPGMQELLAQELPDDGINAQLTYYDEEPLPLSKLAFGSPERYKINTQQLRWVKNLDETYSLTVEYVHEAMSGSSPWYVIPTADEGLLQAMTGATIRDKRDQLNGSLQWNNAGYKHTAALGYSIEDDYQAIFGSYAGEKESTDGTAHDFLGMEFFGRQNRTDSCTRQRPRPFRQAQQFLHFRRLYPGSEQKRSHPDGCIPDPGSGFPVRSRTSRFG